MENIDFNEWEIDKSKSSEDVIVLKKIKKEKALTWEEIQDENIKDEKLFCTINPLSLDNTGLGAATKYVKCQLPSPRIAKKVLALCQMHVIAEYYNRVYANSWIPDWNNKDQEKWLCLWSNKDNVITISTRTTFSSPDVYFASTDLAQMAYKNNKKIFERALKP